MVRSRRKNEPHVRARRSPEDELLSLTQLDEFSGLSLRKWSEFSKALRDLHTELYFGLELARQQHGAELIESISRNLTPGGIFQNWSRIVDYRFCLAPLSMAGSLKGQGGRFNIGSGLNPAAFSGFPALYVAENYSTAYREKFGTSDQTVLNGLNSNEIALRSDSSFTHVALRGQLELVFDISAQASLQQFASIVRKFAVPDRVRHLARKLAMRSPPPLIRSAAGLQRHLLHPDWHVYPMQFDLPANSQVFGRIAVAAGAHGIRYPSVRGPSGHCLALFPQNWKGSASFFEVIDGAPSEARLTRIDGNSPAFL